MANMNKCSHHFSALEAPEQRCVHSGVVAARLKEYEATGRAEAPASELPVPHTDYAHELNKAVSSFCRRCRVYNCVTHFRPHVRYVLSRQPLPQHSSTSDLWHLDSCMGGAWVEGAGLGLSMVWVMCRPQKKRPYTPDTKQEPCSAVCWRLDPRYQGHAAASSAGAAAPEAVAPGSTRAAAATPPLAANSASAATQSTPRQPAKNAHCPGKDAGAETACAPAAASSGKKAGRGASATAAAAAGEASAGRSRSAPAQQGSTAPAKAPQQPSAGVSMFCAPCKACRHCARTAMLTVRGALQMPCGAA